MVNSENFHLTQVLNPVSSKFTLGFLFDSIQSSNMNHISFTCKFHSFEIISSFIQLFPY